MTNLQHLGHLELLELRLVATGHDIVRLSICFTSLRIQVRVFFNGQEKIGTSEAGLESDDMTEDLQSDFDGEALVADIDSVRVSASTRTTNAPRV